MSKKQDQVHLDITPKIRAELESAVAGQEAEWQAFQASNLGQALLSFDLSAEEPQNQGSTPYSRPVYGI